MGFGSNRNPRKGNRQVSRMILDREQKGFYVFGVRKSGLQEKVWLPRRALLSISQKAFS